MTNCKRIEWWVVGGGGTVGKLATTSQERDKGRKEE